MISIILTLVILGPLLYGGYLMVEDRQLEWEMRKKIREANKKTENR